MQSAIKETAWKQIAENGVAALSLRAIARELGITAPAIYNSFPSRDDLVTVLIVDAFTSLGELQKAAIQDLPTDDLAARLSALGRPPIPQRYKLIFGTPIPGYEAPFDITTPAAAGSLVPLIETLQAIFVAGKLKNKKSAQMTPKLKSMLKE